MIKKILIITMSALILFNNSLTVFAKNDMIFFDATKKLQRSNVIMGYDVEGFFDDKYDVAQVTRAEFSVMILNALRKEVVPETKETYFQDCDTKDWYTPYINKLFEMKVVSGYGNSEFKPKNIVTNFEVVTMLVRCLGYDNIKTENGEYPHKYLEIAEQLKLLENISINKTVDEPITYGNMFILLLNAMRSNINDGTQKLWDFGLEASLYKKITGKVASVNDSEYVVANNTESIKLIWNYNEDISTYLNQDVSVWFYQSDSENYAVDMVIELNYDW